MKGSTPPQAESSGDATAPSNTESGMSDSQFNYEIQNNWSMIFTDDNNSTDHDLRSNYSSSVDDNGAENEDQDIELVSDSGIISETDSDYPAFRYLAARRASANSNSTLKTAEQHAMESQENSAATLPGRTGDIAQSSYNFPDPLSQSQSVTEGVDLPISDLPVRFTNDGKILAPERSTTGIKVSGKLKSYAVYIVLGLLILDRSIQLFDLGLPSSKSLFSSSSQPQTTLIQEDSNKDPITVVSYSTKTETFCYSPDSVSIKTIYKIVEPTIMPSWNSAKLMCSNFVSDAKNAGENIWEKSTLGAQYYMENLTVWTNNLMGNVGLGYSTMVNKAWNSLYLQTTKRYNESIETVSQMTANAARAAAVQQSETLSNLASEWSRFKANVAGGLVFSHGYLSTATANVANTSVTALQTSKKYATIWSKSATHGANDLYHDPLWGKFKAKMADGLVSSHGFLSKATTNVVNTSLTAFQISKKRAVFWTQRAAHGAHAVYHDPIWDKIQQGASSGFQASKTNAVIWCKLISRGASEVYHDPIWGKALNGFQAHSKKLKSTSISLYSHTMAKINVDPQNHKFSPTLNGTWNWFSSL